MNLKRKAIMHNKQLVVVPKKFAKETVIYALLKVSVILFYSVTLC